VLDKLTYTSFEPYLHHSFSIHAGDGDPLDVELISVTKLSGGGAHSNSEGKRIPFSIIFRGASSEPVLQQAIYTVEHPELGALEIFLVPIGPVDDGLCYEAVFT